MDFDLASIVAEAERDLPSRFRHQPRKPLPTSNHRAKRLHKLLAKLAKLKAEALVLFMPMALGEAFHASRARWRLAAGSVRSGKTITAAIEFARAHCGCDPYDKYPKYEGRSLVVGLSGDHLGQTMLAKLIEPGAFKIIPDEHTGRWRAVRPDANDPHFLDPYDLAYREKWRDAPPILPPRLVQVKYENVGMGIPRILRFPKTGWRSLWRPAGGSSNPPQGDVYDLGWIDEHIDNEDFYKQMLRGLVDKHGCGIWSACPERANLALIDLRDRFTAGDPRVQQFDFLIDDNPYITDEDKKELYDGLSNEEDRRVKYYGEAQVTGRRVYQGSFDPQGVHGCEPRDPSPEDTHHAAVDPGRQWAGTLTAMVDRDEKYVTVYDAYVTTQCNALKWAREFKKKHGCRRFETIVMDQQMGKQTPVGSQDDRNTAQHYWDALRHVDFLPRTEGPLAGFFPGSNDILAREEALLGLMQVREIGPFAGTAQLQIYRGRMPELERQISRAQYDNKTGQKRVKFPGADELVQCAEYLAASRPGYRVPDPVQKDREFRDHILEVQQAERRRKSAGGPQLG